MAEQVPDLPVMELASAEAWDKWLAKHHASSPGVWLKIAKKGTGVATVTMPEVIETALCWGWIDGLRHRHDDVYFRQRMTPRKRGSRWSRINRDKAEELIDAGRMRPSGLAQVLLLRVPVVAELAVDPIPPDQVVDAEGDDRQQGRRPGAADLHRSPATPDRHLSSHRCSPLSGSFRRARAS